MIELGKNELATVNGGTPFHVAVGVWAARKVIMRVAQRVASSAYTKTGIGGAGGALASAKGSSDGSK